MFSTVVHHPAQLAHSSPVVFVQYLAAVATVRAVRAYGKGHARLPVRIKWPNDVYAERPPDDPGDRAPGWAKVAGVLVTSSYAADAAAYRLLVGVGVNVANSAPTTGLDAVARAAGLPPFRHERLLAGILVELENLHRAFCEGGWDARLEEEYLGMWLHRYFPPPPSREYGSLTATQRPGGDGGVRGRTARADQGRYARLGAAARRGAGPRGAGDRAHDCAAERQQQLRLLQGADQAEGLARFGTCARRVEFAAWVSIGSLHRRVASDPSYQRPWLGPDSFPPHTRV